MADFDAIAGVSTTLQNLLRDRMAEAVPITIAPPDVTVGDAGDVRLNLYLYLVTENGFLKNQEIPGHGHPGTFGHPPLSLDLHYLLTAHGGSDTGADADLRAQQILGDAMRVLHDFPIVTGNLHISRAQAGAVGAPILDDSLVEEFERIKITFQPMTLDDLSKIWTALPQANFRRSVAYLVNVVQIASQQPRRVPRLVGEPPSAGPRVVVTPFQSPQIHELRVRRPGDPANMERPLAYARIGDTVIIRGHNFASRATRVTLGSVDATAQITTLDRIEVTVPDDPQLQPGAQAVQVVQEVMMGEPPTLHRGFHSNLAVFMLAPQITGLVLDVNTIPRTLKIQGKRLFLDTLTGETIIGSVSIAKTAYRKPTATEIQVPLPDTLPVWPISCLMSGALASVPTLPATPQMEVTIGFDGPRDITLTDKATTLSEFAGVLQHAIRQAKNGGPAFQGARVATVDGNRLVIVPGGGGHHPVAVTSSAADTTTATTLKLTAGMSDAVHAYLSGVLDPFPVLTAQQPAVRLTIGSPPPQTVKLAQRPTTLAAAASMLAAAISALLPGAHVTTLDSQLLILVPVSIQTLTFAPAPGADETTVAELQLRASYPVRVRVNRAENIETLSVELPS